MAEMKFFGNNKEQKRNVIIPILCHFIILNCSYGQKRVDELINCNSYIKKFIDTHMILKHLSKKFTAAKYI